MENKSFVIYAKDNAIRIKYFNTSEELEKFVRGYPIDEDNWIEFTVNGEVIEKY